MADYVVKDIGLADWGRKEIKIAETEMPGLMAIHWSLFSAVFVRRGSMVTSLPPRARRASRRSGKPGAVHRLPFDAYGLAPSSTR